MSNCSGQCIGLFNNNHFHFIVFRKRYVVPIKTILIAVVDYSLQILKKLPFLFQVLGESIKEIVLVVDLNRDYGKGRIMWTNNYINQCIAKSIPQNGIIGRILRKLPGGISYSVIISCAIAPN